MYPSVYFGEGRKVDNTEKRMADLENEVASLKALVEDLSNSIHLMAISKLADPRYPYLNLMQVSRVPNEKRSAMESIMMIFSLRFSGQDVSHFKKNLPSVSPELYRNEVPDYDEVVKTLVAFMSEDGIQVSPEYVHDMLVAMKEQGFHKELLYHLLPNSIPKFYSR